MPAALPIEPRSGTRKAGEPRQSRGALAHCRDRWRGSERERLVLTVDALKRSVRFRPDPVKSCPAMERPWQPFRVREEPPGGGHHVFSLRERARSSEAKPCGTRSTGECSHGEASYFFDKPKDLTGHLNAVTE